MENIDNNIVLMEIKFLELITGLTMRIENNYSDLNYYKIIYIDPNTEYQYSYETIYFSIKLKDKIVSFDYDPFCYLLMNRFNLNENDVKIFLYRMTEKYLNCGGYTIEIECTP